MLKIIQERKVTKEYAYRRIFRADYECHGFHCDDNGDPIFRNAQEEKLFNKCFTKPNRYEDCGKVKREYTHVFPAIGLCECGDKLKLEKPFRSPLIKCRCGRLYEVDGTEAK